MLNSGAQGCVPSGVAALLRQPSAGGAGGFSGTLVFLLGHYTHSFKDTVLTTLLVLLGPDLTSCPTSGQGHEGSWQKREEGRRGKRQKKKIDSRSSGARWELGGGSGPGTSHPWAQCLQTGSPRGGHYLQGLGMISSPDDLRFACKS